MVKRMVNQLRKMRWQR